MRFRNWYVCPKCVTTWSDEWSATCEDDCPACGERHITPVESEDLPEEDGEDEEEQYALCGFPRPPVRLPSTALEGFSQVAMTLLPPGEPISPVAPVQEVMDAAYPSQLNLFGDADE